MNSYVVFLVKELVEFVKTWKFLIMLLLFLANAVLSPVLTYITPELFELTGFELNEQMSQLFSRTMNASYTQYFSNQMQMGFLAIVFITCLAIVREKSKGTAVLTLTKNISRPSFILAKFTSYAIWYTVVFFISYGVFIAFTQLLMHKSITIDAFYSMLIFYVVGLFFVASSIFASSVSKNTLISCLIGFGIYALTIILSSIPFIKEFTPGMLIEISFSALDGSYDGLIKPLVITLALIPTFIILGIVSFSKQEL